MYLLFVFSDFWVPTSDRRKPKTTPRGAVECASGPSSTCWDLHRPWRHRHIYNYVYVCIYIYMICMHVYIMYICIYLQETCIYIYIYIHVYIHMHTYQNKREACHTAVVLSQQYCANLSINLVGLDDPSRSHIYTVCMYVYIYIYVYMYIYIYVYMCIYVYIHLHICRWYLNNWAKQTDGE